MDKEEKKYRSLLIFGLVIILIVIYDYMNGKVIPNIFFLNKFSIDNVEAYWKGVISLFTVYISWITFQQTIEKHFFEKKSYAEMQKKDAVRRYQDLLKTAIEILNTKYDNEYECLFAIQIIKNIIDLSINVGREKTDEKEIEPFRIISIEGALGILKGHFDRVLANSRFSEKRQDIKTIIDILYRNNFSDEYKNFLNTVGIYDFKNLFIDMEYFQDILFQHAKFRGVKFYAKKLYIFLNFARENIFENCEFECEFRFYMAEQAQVTLHNCKLKMIEVKSETGMINDRTEKNGTKHLKISNCTVEALSDFSNNVFDSLVIKHTKFKRELFMRYIEVDSELVVSNSEFDNGINFEGSCIKWKMDFSDTICGGYFYFWGCKLLKKEKLCFNNFFVQEFDTVNMSVAVYSDSYNTLNEEDECTFGDLYELVWVEEKRLHTLIRKEENWL